MLKFNKINIYLGGKCCHWKASTSLSLLSMKGCQNFVLLVEWISHFGLSCPQKNMVVSSEPSTDLQQYRSWLRASGHIHRVGIGRFVDVNLKLSSQDLCCKTLQSSDKNNVSSKDNNMESG